MQWRVAARVAAWSLALAVPAGASPVFGLLASFAPPSGRRNLLVAACGITAAILAVVAFFAACRAGPLIMVMPYKKAFVV
jgi:hypothetical protein